MALLGDGFMITFIEVDPVDDQDLNEWYNREHLRERIELPGFRRARRYEAVDAGIRYMTTYEADSPEAIGSPTYLEVLANPTPWSRRVQARFTKAHRLLGRVVLDRTGGVGAHVVLLRLVPERGQETRLTSWLADGLDQVIATPGAVGASVVAVDAAADARMRTGLGMEPGEPPPEWAVLVEGTHREPILEASRSLLLERLAAVPQATEGPTLESYRFLYGDQRSHLTPESGG